ncbi:MAG TPA: hypothetical protein VK425_09030, partial [Acidimicrobiales bacterium]|nr:hypothetical protein [Acidimicrobiales bacterium]
MTAPPRPGVLPVAEGGAKKRRLAKGHRDLPTALSTQSSPRRDKDLAEHRLSFAGGWLRAGAKKGELGSTFTLGLASARRAAISLARRVPWRRGVVCELLRGGRAPRA